MCWQHTSVVAPIALGAMIYGSGLSHSGWKSMWMAVLTFRFVHYTCSWIERYLFLHLDCCSLIPRPSVPCVPCSPFIGFGHLHWGLIMKCTRHIVTPVKCKKFVAAMKCTNNLEINTHNYWCLVSPSPVLLAKRVQTLFFMVTGHTWIIVSGHKTRIIVEAIYLECKAH